MMCTGRLNDLILVFSARYIMCRRGCTCSIRSSSDSKYKCGQTPSRTRVRRWHLSFMLNSCSQARVFLWFSTIETQNREPVYNYVLHTYPEFNYVVMVYVIPRDLSKNQTKLR